MKIFFIDIPFGSVWQTDIANFYEEILSSQRKKITNARLFKKFNILKPNNKTYTLGLLALATYLHKHDYKIEYILNNNSSNYLEKANPKDIFCFSAKTTTINQCLSIAKSIKEKFPHSTIIFGGSHSMMLYEEIISLPFVDVVVLGEGEETLLELVKNISTKKNLETISGIAFIKKNKIIKTPPRPFLSFEKLPPINYDLLPFPIHDFYIYYETRRGCYFGCSYCASHHIWRKQIRTQKAEISYENLKKLAKKLKKNSLIHIINSSFGFDPEDIKLCKLLIQNPIDIFFSCDVCASQISEENVKLMFDAGIRMFSIGMESAANEVLKKNHRPNFRVVKQACITIKRCCDAFIKGYWIIGLPGETEETVKITKETIKYMLENKLLDMSCEHIFVPYPGCNVFHHPRKYDFKIYHKNWNFYDSRSFPLPAESNFFSMGSAYLSYLDIIKMQCELNGINAKNYEKPVTDNYIDFLKHKKHLT